MWEVALAMIMKEEGSKYWERFIVEVGSRIDVFSHPVTTGTEATAKRHLMPRSGSPSRKTRSSQLDSLLLAAQK